MADLLRRLRPHDTASGHVAALLAALESHLQQDVETGVRPELGASLRPPLTEALTERELEVLRLLAEGRSNPEIARMLHVEINTVKTHVKNLYGKLGVHGRVQAVHWAQELGLLRSPPATLAARGPAESPRRLTPSGDDNSPGQLLSWMVTGRPQVPGGPDHGTETDTLMHCSITIKGHLDTSWSEWFDGLTIAKRENGETALVGHLPDQAALHGVLTKVRDLGLTLIAVQCGDIASTAASPARRYRRRSDN